MSGAHVDAAPGQLTETELDVLGVACCGTGEFGEAVELRRAQRGRLGRLVSHEFSARGGAEALHFAMEHPDRGDEGRHPRR